MWSLSLPSKWLTCGKGTFFYNQSTNRVAQVKGVTQCYCCLMSVQVPAGGSAEYPLVYKPLTMTPAEGPPHEGNVFFPIPDGSGLLYKLHGQVNWVCPKLWGCVHGMLVCVLAAHC